jgi:quercetin dioxygenase-like cupin family protein
MASPSAHYTLGDDEAEAVWFIGCLATLKGVGAQTGGALAAVEFTHPPGFATPRHVHHAADEAFYVLEGSLRGFCGDRTWRATTGGFVWLPRGIPHGYAVEGDETLRTLAITVPAGFDQFVADAGEPAAARTLPPPAEPDMPKLLAAGDRHHIETLGPPDF